MDMSKLSDGDLQAIAKGDLRMMSAKGLQMLTGEDQAQEIDSSFGIDLPEPVSAREQFRKKISENTEGRLRGAAGGASDVGNFLINSSTLIPRLAVPELDRWNTERQDSLKSWKDENKDLPGYGQGEMAAHAAATAGLPIPYANLAGAGFRAGVGALGKNILAGGAGGAAAGLLTGDDPLLGGGIGALANAVLPPAIHGATASYGWLDDLFSRNLAKVRGGNIARDIAGKDLELIKQLTAKAPNNIPAAKAATPARNTLWSALGKLSKDLDSNYTTRLFDKQAARRLDVLEKVKPPLDASIAARTAETDPLYKAARESLIPVNTQHIANKVNNLLLRNSGNPELVRELKRIKGGLFDVDGNLRTNAEQVASIIDGIKTSLDNPAMASNKYITKTLLELKDNLTKSIPGLTKADEVFAKYSIPVNQSNLIDTMTDILDKGVGERAKPFLAAQVKLDNKVNEFGGAKEILNPRQLKVRDIVAGQLYRNVLMDKDAAAGAKGLDKILGEDKISASAPGVLHWFVATANKVGRFLEGKINQKTLDAVVEAMRTGKSANEILRVQRLKSCL